MKLLLKVLLIVLLFIPQKYAEAQLALKIGSCSSAFDVENSEHLTYMTFGLAFQKQISFNIVLAGEINYLSKGGLLKDILIDNESGWPGQTWGGDLYDFHVKIRYINIPLMIKYNIRIRESIKIQPYIGHSVSLPYLADHTKRKNRREILSEDPLTYTGFAQQGENFPHVTMPGFIAGSSLIYKRMLIDFRYFRDNNEIRGVDTITIIPKTNYGIIVSFGIMFSLEIKPNQTRIR